MTENKKTQIIAVVVAAGVGSRMGAKTPKQYLMLAGKTMLEMSVEAMLAESRIERLIVVISPSDLIGQTLTFTDPRVEVARVGGTTRAMSVKNGITYSAAGTGDWVLIHDAARPCLAASDLSKLIDTCIAEDQGGILAIRVNDTLKAVNEDGEIEKTVPRDGMWAAQTPQMFKADILNDALEKAGSAVTDEASALEFVGLKPMVIEGSSTNIKVTRPEDLWIAQAILDGRTASVQSAS